MPPDSIDQLFTLLADVDLVDDYLVPALRCRSAEMTEEQLTLGVDVFQRRSIHSRWVIECEGVIEHRVTLGSYDFMTVHDDHPLLLEHLQPSADLYFTKAADNPAETRQRLQLAHTKILGEWRTFNRYTNSGVDLVQLLSEPSGKLAAGPRVVIDAYAAAASALPTTVLPLGRPKRWDAHRGEFLEIPEVRLLMLSAGDEPTFAVAERFTALRLPDSESGN